MRRLTLSFVALATLTAMGSAVPSAPAAHAAEPLCQGHAATIVAGSSVEGTDGNDVIVATGANIQSVSGNAGDDLICLYGPLYGDGFELPEVSGGPGIDSLVVRGGPDRDFLAVWDDIEKLDISLGPDQDKLRMYEGLGVGGTGVIKGGDGDILQVREFSKSVRVDLEDGVLELDGTGKYTVSGFSRISASAPRVFMAGDRRANGLMASGCRVTVQGGRGNDVLIISASFCDVRGARVSGQKGDDLMVGDSQNDVLLGGPGEDRARGRGGRDRCVAEMENSCER